MHKRRALNTRLSSGTSAGTFEVAAGPYSPLFLNWYKKCVRFIFSTCFGLIISVKAL